MKCPFLTLIFCFALSFSFGQSLPDTSNKNIIKPERELTFTKAEIMPQFKFGLRALADSVKKDLLKTKLEFRPEVIELVLLINKSGDVTDVQIPNDPNYPKAQHIKKFLLTTSGLWLPAKQNGHIVPCYKRLFLDFSKNNLKITARY